MHLQYGWDSELIVANALFADGAGAMVVEGGGADSVAPYRVVASGSALIDDSEEAMSWRIGDHGFTMTLSSRVPEIINGQLRPWLESWLRPHGLGLDDVGSWAVHPGGPRILSAFEEATGLGAETLETSRRVLADHGNMSSPTIVFILDRMRPRWESEAGGRRWLSVRGSAWRPRCFVELFAQRQRLVVAVGEGFVGACQSPWLGRPAQVGEG